MSMRYSYALLFASAALAFSLQSASAKTLVVTQNTACTSGYATFSTIQSAVNAASKGDVVAVCPGTYPEQVSIIRGITLEGFTSQSVSITVPNNQIVQNGTRLNGSPIAAQILVQPALSNTNVTIKNLMIDGSNNNDNTNGCSSPDLMGIYYQNAGGTITGNTVENQLMPDGLQGCQLGQGIFVENQNPGQGKVTISSNIVSNFDKNGITIHLGAANAIISKNTVTGLGPTDLIAQNGIEAAYGATAAITTNTISNLIYTPATYGSSGILLYDLQNGTYPAVPSVVGNTVTSAQYGVVLDAANGASNALLKVSGNKIDHPQFAGVGLYTDSPGNDDYINVASNKIQNTSPYDGIDACSNNNTITSNTVINSTTESAIHLDGLCGGTGVGNTVTNNHMTVACVGILSGPPQTSNTIILTGMGKNTFTDVTNPTVFGQDTYSCSSARWNGGSVTAKHLGSPQPVHY